MDVKMWSTFLLAFHGALYNVHATGPLPLIITTWQSSYNSSNTAWDLLYNQGRDMLDAVEEGISENCEMFKCAEGVGPYYKVDEFGDLSLDALMMDGRTHSIGAVGALRRVRRAISVARAVMTYTQSTLLTGDAATEFAVQMGFKEEDIRSEESNKTYTDWKDRNCQPNFWEVTVTPDPSQNCGPYSPMPPSQRSHTGLKYEEPDHDTINMIVIDSREDTVVGVSTNGLNHKIKGRVGDSPVPGAGGYVDNDVGGAACTGNGDVMMRFLPSYQAVGSMRQGLSPAAAAAEAIRRMVRFYPTFAGAIITASISGDHGCACTGYTTFTYMMRNPDVTDSTYVTVNCNATQARNCVEKMAELSVLFVSGLSLLSVITIHCFTLRYIL